MKCSKKKSVFCVSFFWLRLEIKIEGTVYLSIGNRKEVLLEFTSKMIHYWVLVIDDFLTLTLRLLCWTQANQIIIIPLTRAKMSLWWENDHNNQRCKSLNHSEGFNLAKELRPLVFKCMTWLGLRLLILEAQTKIKLISTVEALYPQPCILVYVDNM